MIVFYMRNWSIFLIIALFLYSSAFADIYKYTDKNGDAFYTDVPTGKKSSLHIRPRPQKVSYSPAVEKISSSNYHSIIHEKASKHGIDPLLVKAVIRAESNGNAYAVSKKGALGVMQLMPFTANELNVRNPFDPEQNIDGGVRYLRYLLERFKGDLTLALAAYNAGPGSVERFGKIPPYSETKQYVKKVLSLYNGKNAYLPPSEQVVAKEPEPIYRIEMSDGTLLFTNTLLSKSRYTKF